MSESNDLFHKLTRLATVEIAQIVQDRCATEALDEDGNPLASKLFEILEWGQAEARRRIAEAKAVIDDESIIDEDKTRRIFKIMLGGRYDEYVQRYEEETGKQW